MFNTKKWSLAGLFILSSTAAYAAPITASFSGVADGGSSFNQFSVIADGITVNVSGWSDTKNIASETNSDSTIERAKDLDKYNGGWAMENRDEPSDYCGSNGHSADNFGTCGWKDYDFFMLAFSEAVSLTQATYGWVAGSGSEANKASQNQVSVVALNSTTINNTLQNRTWSGVKNNHTLSSDYSQMQSSGGYYTNFGGTNVAGEFSTHWLIGALNSKFGGTIGMEGNDGMKLAGVSFNKQKTPPHSSVPEPSSILLLGLAIMGLAASSRRKLK